MINKWQISSVDVPEQKIRLAHFSANGSKLLVVQHSKVIHVWDVATRTLEKAYEFGSDLEGKEVYPFSSFKLSVESVVLSFDGRIALIGLNDGTARLLSVPNGDELSSFRNPNHTNEGYFSPIRSVNFSLDGSLSVVGFSDRSVGIWRTDTLERVYFLSKPHPFIQYHEGSIGAYTTSVMISRDNRFLFAGYSDLTATIWKLENGQLILDSYEHTEEVLDVLYQDKTLTWITNAGSIWKSNNEDTTSKIFTLNQHLNKARLFPDKNAIYSLKADKKIIITSFDGDEELLGIVPKNARDWTLEERDSPIKYYHQTKTLVLLETLKRITVMTPTNKRSFECEGDVLKFELNLNNKVLASMTSKNTIELWDVLWEINFSSITGEVGHELKDFCFSPNGVFLAVNIWSNEENLGLLQIWDTLTLEKISEIKTSGDQIAKISFDADDRWIVFTTWENKVCLWDWKGGGRQEKHVSNLNPNELFTMIQGRIILLRKGEIEIWHELKEKITTIQTDADCLWKLSEGHAQLITGRNMQIFEIWDMTSYTLSKNLKANIFRPEPMLTDKQLRDLEALDQGYLWSNSGEYFGHTSYIGPRDWKPLLQFSNNHDFVAIPCRDKSIILHIAEKPSIVTHIHSKKRIKAFHVADDHLLAVNEIGEVFTELLHGNDTC